MIDVPDAAPLSALWWVDRLFKQIRGRRAHLDKWDAYYRGEHPLPWLPDQAVDEFRRILRMTRANYMGLVVDSKAERIEVQGFRDAGSPSPNDDLWRIWQDNDMDADSDQAWLEMLIGGVSYLMVAPNPADKATPIITIEHASQCIVEYEPGTNRRRAAAGLKVWVDDWTGTMCATLFLAPSQSPLADGKAWVFKFEAVKGRNGRALMSAWIPRAVAGEQWPAPNMLDEVPIYELPNKPRLITGGVSELADVTDIQDRINKTIADRLMTQDFGAFPQKWATGYPTEDELGRPADPVDVGRNRMVSTDATETKFGQWDAAPLDPYSNAKREDVKDIASRTRVPAQYLLGEMSNVNGETLKASESGLVASIMQSRRYGGEGLERAMRGVQKAAGLKVTPRLETIWRNPEFRTEGETVDALVKMRGLKVPLKALWLRWGATPQEMDLWRKWLQEESSDSLLGALDSLSGSEPAATDPVVAEDPTGQPSGAA